MPKMNRAERRARLRDLSKLQPKLKKTGFSFPVDMSEAESAALLFRDCLTNMKDGRRAITAALLGHRLYDATETHCPSTALRACKAGCDYCCYVFVSLTAPEAFLIAEHLVADQAIESFKLAASPLVGLNARARFEKAKLPCSLLRDRRCSIHPHRPLKCRNHNSSSADACLAAFNGSQQALPLLAPLMMAGVTCDIALRTGMYAAGYNPVAYELNEAVLRIVETDKALERWSGGEDIFAGVQIDGSIAPHVKNWIEETAALIA